jgi:hypothetical protein
MSAARGARVAGALLVLCALAGTTATAGVTSLRIESGTGEPVGGGQFYFYTPADGELAEDPGSLLPHSREHFTFAFTSSDTADLTSFDQLRASHWQIFFSAAPGESLAVGPYAYDESGNYWTEGRLNVIRGDTFCEPSSAGFDIGQIVFDANDAVSAFQATFEQTCGNATLRGEIRYNADTPLVLTAPSRATGFRGSPLAFDVLGTDTGGESVFLASPNLPAGASFTDDGNGHGRFEWTPAAGQDGLLWLAFEGRSDGRPTETVYTQIEVLPYYDDIDQPIPFSTLPFRSTVDAPPATRAADDPSCDIPWATGPGTVWYAFTPAEDTWVQVDATPLGLSAPSPAFLSAYTGTRGSLSRVAPCRQPARFHALAGTTYLILVEGVTPTIPLYFRANALPPPPANDLLADSKVILALPYDEEQDVTNAGRAAEDPWVCGAAPPPYVSELSTVPNVWYAWTPDEETVLSVHTGESNFLTTISAFRGTQDALVPLACARGHLSFTAAAGQTYRFMIDETPGSGVLGPGFGGITHLILRTTFHGAPPLHIGARIDSDGSFEARTGSGSLHGVVTCSRPAHIALTGNISQPRGLQGRFETVVACTGETRWAATFTTERGRGSNSRATTGSAPVTLAADGVPDDNPDDHAAVTLSSAVTLKRMPGRTP